MKNRMLYLFAALLLTCGVVMLPHRSAAQHPPISPDMPVDEATKTAVIDLLLKELNETYVFPETAKKMESDIRARVAAKEYDAVTTSRGLAEKLTADLQSVSRDKHLRVRYSYDVLPSRADRREPTTEEIEQSKWFNRRVNYGFEK